MRGDASDGLPGVPGIGEKTAASLLATYGDLDGIEAAADDPASDLRPRIRQSLLDSRDYITAARTVVAVREDVATVDAVVPLAPLTADVSDAFAAFGYDVGPRRRPCPRDRGSGLASRHVLPGHRRRRLHRLAHRAVVPAGRARRRRGRRPVQRSSRVCPGRLCRSSTRPILDTAHADCRRCATTTSPASCTWLATSTPVTPCGRPLHTYEQNVTGTASVLHAMRRSRRAQTSSSPPAPPSTGRRASTSSPRTPTHARSPPMARANSSASG